MRPSSDRDVNILAELNVSPREAAIAAKVEKAIRGPIKFGINPVKLLNKCSPRYI